MRSKFENAAGALRGERVEVGAAELANVSSAQVSYAPLTTKTKDWKKVFCRERERGAVFFPSRSREGTQLCVVNKPFVNSLKMIECRNHLSGLTNRTTVALQSFIDFRSIKIKFCISFVPFLTISRESRF